MKVVVPDASVLLKWILPSYNEVNYEKALKIRQGAISGEITLKVPSLWVFEVGNAIDRRFRKESKRLVQALLNFGLEEPKFDADWSDRCLALSHKYNVTFYDAAYHSLALLENGVFVTADEQYVNKTCGEGAVICLSEWE
jgi:predicted nucleic acid-binding protein